jgi:hypothetical protein
VSSAAVAGKEDKNKKIKSKPNEPLTAGAASQGSQFGPGSFYIAAD